MGSCTASHVVHAIAIAMVLLLFGSMVQAQRENYQLSSNESYAMHQLFETWRNTPRLSNNLPGWTNSTSPCDASYPWEGVRCLWKAWSNDSSRGDKYVVGMRLIGSNLVGTLPPAIGMLQSLITFSIQENPNLNGTLPKEVGNLPSVNSMKLIGNNFSGSIPNNVASSTFLQQMDLSRNKFNGEIREDLFSSALGLIKVNMSWNKFEGEFPRNIFSNATLLIEVDFSHNNFSGPLPNFNPYFNHIDFSYNQFQGKLLNSIMMQNLDFIKLSNNQLSGELSPLEIFNTSTRITTLDLSNNKFFGLLPNFDFLTSLETLDLSYNNFNYGPFPSWIANLSTLKSLSLNGNYLEGSLDVSRLGSSLQELNLEFNNIKEVLYNGLMKDLKVSIRLQGNPYCNNSSTSDLKKCVCEQYCIDTGEDAKDVIKITIISVVTCSLLLAIIIMIVALLLWKTKREQKYVLLAVQQRFLQYDVKPTLFTFPELRMATKDFNSSMKLGEGTFGIVYKGVLSNGNHVAIKQLFNIDAQKDIDDFLNEVVLLTSVKHRNLVNLKGCCLHRNQRWLVFEYVENFDIDQVLFENKGGIILDWSQRLNICIGIAQGLHYLHALSQPRIIHRDIKASNVLLDKTFNAKIADFGLALLFPDEQSHVTTFHVAGSRGYLAPEYATMGQLSEKADVYSFGSLMLEIISGRRNIDYNLPQNKIYLSRWAWKLHTEDKLMDLVDSTLSLDNREEMEIKQAINIALLCSQIQADSRPTMAQVVGMLRGHSSIESELTSYLANREIEEESYYSHMVMEGANLNLISIPENSSVRVFSGPLSSTIE